MVVVFYNSSTDAATRPYLSILFLLYLSICKTLTVSLSLISMFMVFYAHLSYMALGDIERDLMCDVQKIDLIKKNTAERSYDLALSITCASVSLDPARSMV